VCDSIRGNESNTGLAGERESTMGLNKKKRNKGGKRRKVVCGRFDENKKAGLQDGRLAASPRRRFLVKGVFSPYENTIAGIQSKGQSRGDSG
jgi:hypothetical protein